MIIKGDVNGDGRITIEDLLLIQSHILRIITLRGDNFVAADVNNDGDIGVTDLAKVQKHLLGVEILDEVIY